MAQLPHGSYASCAAPVGLQSVYVCFCVCVPCTACRLPYARQLRWAHTLPRVRRRSWSSRRGGRTGGGRSSCCGAPWR